MRGAIGFIGPLISFATTGKAITPEIIISPDTMNIFFIL
jgi:hypothetical protein